MRKHTATLSSKGQIVLPREIRDRLGVQMGDEVEFVIDDAGIHVRPWRDEGHPFAAWLGAAPSHESAADFDQVTRHAGLDQGELNIFRAGPGARVIHLNLGPDDA